MLCISAFSQKKGTAAYLEKMPGVYPLMLNDSITKHLRDTKLVGEVKNGSGYAKLDESLCVLNTANLIECNVYFKRYIIASVFFYVSPIFKVDCKNELYAYYGEPTYIEDGEYTWESENYVLTYQMNCKDANRNGQAFGIFVRKQEMESW